jgi:hypothetical protein
LSVLDPRISYAGLRNDYTDDPDLVATAELAKSSLQTHFEIYYAQPEMDATSSAATTAPDNIRSPVKNFTSRYVKQSGINKESELDCYFTLTSQPLPWDTNPIMWWNSHRTVSLPES